MNRLLSASMLLAVLTHASGVQAQPGAPECSVGLGAAVSDSPYAGEGTRVRAFPFIAWQGERAYLRGLDLGFRAWQRGPWSLDLALSGRLDGFDAKDLGRRELAANGIDRDLLDDRDDGLDAAASMRYATEQLNIDFELRHDLSGASEGGEARLRIGRPLRDGPWLWTPYVQARWLSADLAGYYYGISDGESARALPAYRPGSAVLPEAGVALNRRLGERWFLFGNLRFSALPDALSDSPLLDGDSEPALFFALGRSF